MSQITNQQPDNQIPDANTYKLAAHRIAKARTRLLLNKKFVFWATCALYLRPIPIAGLGTLGTDGTYLIYDPILVASDHFDDDELMTVIAHEVSHVAKGDTWRRGARDPLKWNIACDRRINPELAKAGLKEIKPPDSSDPAKIVQYRAQFNNPADFGRAAEEIYQTIPDSQGGGGTITITIDASGHAEARDGSNSPGGSRGLPSSDPGGAGLVFDAGSLGKDGSSSQGQTASQRAKAKEDQERKWGIIVKNAAQIAKGQGHLPSGYEYLLEPVKPKLDPYAMLGHFVSMCRKDDYSWSRGSRRHIGRGMYLPSLYSEGIGEIIIAADVSGSTQSVWPLFVGFLNSVLIEVKPDKTHFLEIDAAVHNHTEYGPGEELPQQVAIHGGGGTCMRPIWQWVEDNNINPVCAIVLTDLEMSERDFGDVQSFPTLWISSTAGKEAPWGETVEMLE